MEKYNKEELERLIFNENVSYTKIGEKFGVTGNSIKKAARRLGINLPIRRQKNPKESFSRKKRIVESTSLANTVAEEVFIEAIKSSMTWKEIGRKLGYNGSLGSHVKEVILKRCETLGLTVQFDKVIDIGSKTKSELFSQRKNWQSARSAIRKHANEVFDENHPVRKCFICGYDKHVEVAHVKAVSDFSGDATVNEINNINNLVGLCPNHHWEFDNGLIKI